MNCKNICRPCSLARSMDSELRAAPVPGHTSQTVLAPLLDLLDVTETRAVLMALGFSVLCGGSEAFLCATLHTANVLFEDECAPAGRYIEDCLCC